MTSKCGRVSQVHAHESVVKLQHVSKESKVGEMCFDPVGWTRGTASDP